MFAFGCAAELATIVTGAWRRPSSAAISRAVLSRSWSRGSCSRAQFCSASHGLSTHLRFYSTSSRLSNPAEMAWSHRPSIGCADVNDWHKHFPDAAGKQQSPIDLTKGVYNESLASKPLKLEYKEARECTLVNNGHSVQVNFKPSVGGLTGGPVTDNFELAQYHFHWGAGNEKGSEHTVDGNFYPNELHLVHWNTSEFSSVSDAASQPNGLTVLGIFLEVGDEHVELKKITDRFDKIKHASQQVDVEDPICVKDLLPSDTKSYWSYDGSLTTPPCYESVNWIVFREPIKVSQAQLDAFRSVCEAADDAEPDKQQSLVDNYRPVCPLNDRTLHTTFKEE